MNLAKISMKSVAVVKVIDKAAKNDDFEQPMDAHVLFDLARE